MEQLKRAHSAEPDNNSTPETSQRPAWGESATTENTGASDPAAVQELSQKPSDISDEALVGSPLKRQRPSVDQGPSNDKYSATQSMSAALDSVISGGPRSPEKPNPMDPKPKIEEEEL